MPGVPNIYQELCEQALTLALRDGHVDPAEAQHLAAIEDAHNRVMAVCGVLKAWTGVPREVERQQPEWLPDLINATQRNRTSA